MAMPISTKLYLFLALLVAGICALGIAASSHVEILTLALNVAGAFSILAAMVLSRFFLYCPYCAKSVFLRWGYVPLPWPELTCSRCNTKLIGKPPPDLRGG